MARYQQKTHATAASVEAFLAAVPHPTRRADAQALDRIFRAVTGFAPRMWGDTMVGYGSYSYTYATGHSGTALATGFSPRKANLSIYIMPGYADHGPILARLGKHKLGKSCLYVTRLADIDTGVLAELIRAGLADLGARWPVQPT